MIIGLFSTRSRRVWRWVSFCFGCILHEVGGYSRCVFFFVRCLVSCFVGCPAMYIILFVLLMTEEPKMKAAI